MLVSASSACTCPSQALSMATFAPPARTRAQVCVCWCMCACVRACVRACVCAHTDTHIHTLTHTHTAYTHVSSRSHVLHPSPHATQQINNQEVASAVIALARLMECGVHDALLRVPGVEATLKTIAMIPSPPPVIPSPSSRVP